MGTHSFYDQDTGKQVFGVGKYGTGVVYKSQEHFKKEEDKEKFFKAFSKAVNLLGFTGVLQDSYGKYLPGCRMFETSGFALVKIHAYRNGVTEGAEPLSPVFLSLQEFKAWISQSIPELIDEMNTLTDRGQKIWDYIEGLEAPDQVFEILVELHQPLSDWWGWSRE